MAGGEGQFSVPAVDYSDDPKDEENYVKIRVDIPKLKKKFMKKEASNAEIDLQLDQNNDSTSSFCLIVTVQGKAAPTKYKYEIKQLPDPVLTAPKSSYFKVERDDEVVLYLHKASPRTWNVQLDAQGLETITS